MKSLLKSIILVASIVVNGAKPVLAEIVLQPHQKIPVQYLKDHPSQKGLLLYHSLGSGKTYIALEYAEKNPTKNVVIFLPQFLKSNWVSQMRSFGVKNTSRYEMLSLDEADQLLKRDLSNTIVIVDEVHKLIQNIKAPNLKTSEHFIAVYQKIQSANKILLLTGTPIFMDTTDISYVANLLEASEPFPVDPTQFRNEYMKIKPVTSLVRGQVTESKLMMVGVPFFMTLAAVATFGATLPWAAPLAALLGTAIIPATNELIPVSEVAFREFNADKWAAFAKKYISYYSVKLSYDENYPEKKVTERKVEYNEPQANLFLNFVDENLTVSELRTLLKEENASYTDSYLKYHSSRLQKQLLANFSSGMEIGNLEFIDKNKKLIEPPKFMEILKIIQNQPGQVVIYSNYFHNGIQKIASFLDRHGFKGQSALISPDQSVEAQVNIIDQYNAGKKRILLIHPEVTEGISLNGTEQFHVLEPIRNASLLDQVIGRAIRYQSHAHLPKERRLVNVYLWESEIQYSKMGIPTSAALLRREHWQKNYAEINPSMWTKGILEVDSNYFLKDDTPDQRVKRLKSLVQLDIHSFQDLLEKYSIETTLER